MTAPVKARPAATILVVRDAPKGLEVLMVERHGNIEFGGGALVFPGGRVGRMDHDRRLRQRLVGGRLHGANRDILAFQAAAVRELFEETGLILPTRRSRHWLDEGRRQSLARRLQAAIDAGRKGLADLLLAGDLWLDPHAIVPFAHWITPISYPKRFDTRFFIARAPRTQAARHDGHEMVHSVWIRPQDALAAGGKGHYRLMFPTRMNLKRLAESASVSDALRRARQRPQVAVLPEFFQEDGQLKTRVPRRAGYGEILFRED